MTAYVKRFLGRCGTGDVVYFTHFENNANYPTKVQDYDTFWKTLVDHEFRQDAIQHPRHDYELVTRRLRAPPEILLSKAVEDVAAVPIAAAVVRGISYEPPKNLSVPLPEASVDHGREPPPLAREDDDGNRRVAGEKQRQEKSGAGDREDHADGDQNECNDNSGETDRQDQSGAEEGDGKGARDKKQASTPFVGGSSLELDDNQLAALTRTPSPGWPVVRPSAEHGQQSLEGNGFLWTSSRLPIFH